MKKLLATVLAILLPLAAVSGDGADIKAEITAAVEAFNTAYATNDVEGYFSNYEEDAMLYFEGARQPVSAYYDLWTSMVEGGGGVEKNAMSQVQVQILQGGNSAVASYFVDNVTRSADGERITVKAFESDVWVKKDGKWKIVAPALHSACACGVNFRSDSERDPNHCTIDIAVLHNGIRRLNGA